MTVPRRKPSSRRDEPAHASAQRRRRKRIPLYGGLEDRDVYLGNLAHTAVPTTDFFTFSLLSGVLLSAALFLDAGAVNARAIFVLAALAAPFLAPLIGLSLAAVSGSLRFFFHSLGGLLVGVVLVFGAGAAAGLAARLWSAPQQANLLQAAAFSWPDAAVLVAGAVFIAIRLYRYPLQNPRLASAALAYELYLPAAAAAYGLSAGFPLVFQAGLTSFVLRLSLAVLVSTVVFDLQGLRRRLRENSSLPGSILLTAIVSILFLSAGSFTRGQMGPLANPPTPTGYAAVSQVESTPAASLAAQETSALAASLTPSLTATNTPSHEPRPTMTHTITRQPTRTDTPTITPEPKPYLAVVKVSGAAGAYIREEPAGAVVSSVLNGSWVEIQPQYAEQTVNDTIWVFIRTDDGVEGWMMKSLLDIRASTPMP